MFVLDQLDLLNSSAEPAYDRLTALVATVLNVPVALISLVTHDRQFFKSQVGLGEPWASQRETPLTHSFCQYVVETRAPLVIADAREEPLVADNQAIPDLGVIAYAGMPLHTSNGETIGALCAIDHTPRVWTEKELALLESLSHAVMTEIASLEKIRHLQETQATRMELYDELLLHYTTMLDTLSTPVVPLSESAVLMPLRGTMNNYRATQLVTALQCVLRNPGVQTVLLDLTDMVEIDAGLALALDMVVERVKPTNTSIVLTGLVPMQESLVRCYTNLVDDLPRYPTVQQALHD